MYNHVIFIQNIYLFRNPPASTRPSALRRCGPPPRALLCIRNSDVEALCPQALLVSLDELHAVLMLGTLLRDACVPGTLAGRRQNKCEIESRSVSCPNASGVTSRSLDDLSLSLSLSLSVLGVFASKWRGCPRSHLRFRAGAADLLLRLPVSPSPRGLLIAPPCHRQSIASLSQTTTSPTSALLALLALLACESGFRILNFWSEGLGEGSSKKKTSYFFLEEGKARAPGSAER